jgi:hypothetical protein
MRSCTSSRRGSTGTAPERASDFLDETLFWRVAGSATGRRVATEKTYICLKCQQTMIALPEFDTYLEVWEHNQQEHDGSLFVDTRIRVKK